MSRVNYSDKVRDNANLFVNKTEEEIEVVYGELTGITDPALLKKNAAEIYHANESLIKLADSIDANTKASEAETDAIKLSLLANNKIVQDS